MRLKAGRNLGLAPRPALEGLPGRPNPTMTPVLTAPESSGDHMKGNPIGEEIKVRDVGDEEGRREKKKNRQSKKIQKKEKKEEEKEGEETVGQSPEKAERWILVKRKMSRWQKRWEEKNEEERRKLIVWGFGVDVAEIEIVNQVKGTMEMRMRRITNKKNESRRVELVFETETKSAIECEKLKKLMDEVGHTRRERKAKKYEGR
eukprot:GCRY01004131.1.p1 GENE.GCRY01004131.1~~GCRY01004131.1.p1  ORF type:complete len:204 (-),score=21.57 GCRY01004131.1:1710-2321(-)